jgi:predicted DNA-binding protein YlxM (UPF0122 family)
MATRKPSDALDLNNVQQALLVIQQLYQDFTPNEITEAFKINRQAITAKETEDAIKQEIAQLSQSLNNPNDE